MAPGKRRPWSPCHPPSIDLPSPTSPLLKPLIHYHAIQGQTTITTAQHSAPTYHRSVMAPLCNYSLHHLTPPPPAPTHPSLPDDHVSCVALAIIGPTGLLSDFVHSTHVLMRLNAWVRGPWELIHMLNSWTRRRMRAYSVLPELMISAILRTWAFLMGSNRGISGTEGKTSSKNSMMGND